jgi:plastocyanin
MNVYGLLSARLTAVAVLAMSFCVVASSCSTSSTGNSSRADGGEIEMYGDDGAYGFGPKESETSSVVIKFFNTSDAMHNVKFSSSSGVSLPTSKMAKPGETLEVRLPNEPGVWSYVCVLHPGMDGVLTLVSDK